MKKLPASIEIIGQEILIKESPTHYERHDEYGKWTPKENCIRMQSLKAGFSKDAILASYYHEVTHAVLDLTGHSDLSADESFVERLGQAFYQAEKTRRYAKKTPDCS